MPYIIDRQRALSAADIVAIIGLHERRVRSRTVLRDNSLYRTLTRARTFVRHTREQPAGAVQIGSRAARQGSRGRSKGAAWRKQQ